MVAERSKASESPSPRPTLVTGCSSGIGRAIAARLASAGWPIYASARRMESIEDLAELGCTLLTLDVTDDSDRRAAVHRIEREHGALGGLVNNAGYGQQGPLEETPLDAIRTQFETNVFGAIALCQLALPAMRRAGRGRIVNISSMGGRLTFPGGGAYHGSKFALEAMSDVLRFEVSGFGIDVVVIEPGPTSSAFGEASIRSLDSTSSVEDDAYASFRAGIRSALESTFESPPPGAATPDDVAEAVWASLTEEEPAPRVVVGEMARELISLHRAGSARDWDRVVGQMYPQPGREPETE